MTYVITGLAISALVQGSTMTPDNSTVTADNSTVTPDNSTVTADTSTGTADPCHGPLVQLPDTRRSIDYQLQSGETGINDQNTIMTNGRFEL